MGGLPGSGTLNFALRLRDMACVSSRRYVVGCFDNNSICRILHMGSRDCVLSVELRRRLRLLSIQALLAQRRFHWFGHAARRPEGELIKDLLVPKPPRTGRSRAGGQLKTWAATIKVNLEPRIFSHARWRKGWVAEWSLSPFNHKVFMPHCWEPPTPFLVFFRGRLQPPNFPRSVRCRETAINGLTDHFQNYLHQSLYHCTVS